MTNNLGSYHRRHLNNYFSGSKDGFGNRKYSEDGIRIMGFLKKLKETTEKPVEKGAELAKKGVEKGAEVGTKAYDGVKEGVEKGRDKAREKSKEA